MLIGSAPFPCLGKQRHSPRHLCLFFWQEMLYDGHLCLSTAPFERCNKYSTTLSNSYAFGPPISLIFTPTHQPPLDKLVNETAGNRHRTPEQFGYLLDSESTFFVKQHERR
jgi:hypothetical protein